MGSQEDQVKKHLSAILATLGALCVASVASAQIRAEIYVQNLRQPVAMIQDPTNPNVQFVVQQNGLIRVLVNGAVQGTDFLNVSGRISTGGERGLLGLAFAPDYATSRNFYINYTERGSGATIIAEFKRNVNNPLIADDVERRLLTIAQPFSNHNGGGIAFGPDNFLYIGMGDGGSGDDPQRHGQRTDSLLGKFLRIDVTRDDFPNDANRNYGIPSDNPYLDGIPVNAPPEVWSFGWRNPWRWSFDDPRFLGRGSLIAADVGQSSFEEVNFEPAGAGGRNYGWRPYEGNVQRFPLSELAYQPVTFPLLTYSHDDGRSITGGFVYRGTQLGHQFFGRYFYADFIFGRVWSTGLVYNFVGEATAVNPLEHSNELGSVGSVSSFAVDSNGELYIINYNGIIYRVRPNGLVWIEAVRRQSSRLTGDIRELLGLDGKPLTVVGATGVFPNVNPQIPGVVVNLRTDLLTPPTIDVQLRARLDRNVDGILSLSFRDRNTGNFVRVATFPVNGSYQSFRADNLDASRFRSTTGQIDAFLTINSVDTDLERPANLQIDWFAVDVN